MIAEVIVDIATSETDKIFDYLCDDTVRIGHRVFAPFGNRNLFGFVVGLKETTDYPMEKMKSVTPFEDDQMPALTEELVVLAKQISRRYRVPLALSLRLFLPTEMRTGKIRELVRRYVTLIEKDEYDCGKTAKKQAQAVEYLKQNGKTLCSEISQKFGGGIVTALVKKGFAVITEEKLDRDPYKTAYKPFEERTLTEDQQKAVDFIKTDNRTVELLHGVTGSGKTEVYLTLIADSLQQGKSSIFLVPEISLTPQMLAQLRARFGKSCAILHSGLSAGERFDEWWRLRSGEAKIAIGARSAIFAPLSDLGVIIIDEEHDSSYQSETSPRYSTYDIAFMRAKNNRCKLVLGSATPDLTTYQKAKSGEFGLIQMTKRINKKPMPEIMIADMRREVRRGNNSSFSTLLKDELEKCLADGNQAILFLNRRGYSPNVICKECGYVAKCESCDVALTYHKDEDCLKCHYCGARYKMLRACPECSGTKLTYSGTGTERVETELKKAYPNLRVLRMDNDTTSGKEGHYKILKEFGEHKADVLVGTQMIAKGHDFPSVTLVGILDADMSLHFSDYRSGERTFQLITQVAGRSGRAEEKGKVVLQTYSPDNEVLKFACDYDYSAFYENEISIRAVTQFPPFCKIVRVMVSGEDEKKTIEVLKDVYFRLEELYKNNMEKFLFFNKMKSPIKRIQNKFRYQVLMRITDNQLLAEIYNVSVETKTKDVLVAVEENPSSLT